MEAKRQALKPTYSTFVATLINQHISKRYVLKHTYTIDNMTVFHLNVDVGEAEATSLLREHCDSDCVTVETKLQIVPTQELTAIFEGLAARFTGMKQFFVKRIVSLPAQALARVLVRQEQLEFLYLQNVSLAGDIEDFERLAEALRCHKGLRKIRFYMLRPSLRTAASILNPVVSAIASTPNLQEVSLIHCRFLPALAEIDPEVEQDQPNGDNDGANDNNNHHQQQQQQQQQQHEPVEEWDGKSILDLCSSRSLKILTLTCSGELKDQHIEQMGSLLESNNTLQNISIRATDLGPAAGISLGKLLKSNPNLERLRVQLSACRHAVPILEGLHRNTNLQRLGLVLPKLVDTEKEGVRAKVLGKMTDMLRKSNYNLLHMDLVGLLANTEEIRFYLKVNQAGRKSLLAEGATRDEWVRTICTHNDDLSVMFYFLSRNPNLCLAVFRRMIALEDSSSNVSLLDDIRSNASSPRLSTTTALMTGSKRVYSTTHQSPRETISPGRKKSKQSPNA